MQRDRFELLSAYIDHEVTADERRQVETWIAEDQNFAAMHRRMVKLQRGFQSLQAPVATEHVDVTIAQVLKKVDRPRPTWKVFAGGGAIAAAAVAAIAILPGLFGPTPSTQFATRPAATSTNAVNSDNGDSTLPNTLTVAVSLDQPAFVTPKKAVADQ
jgi:anti-sigma factor RsiW